MEIQYIMRLLNIDAKHIIVHLLKTITKENINKLNSNGETLLTYGYEN